MQLPLYNADMFPPSYFRRNLIGEDQDAHAIGPGDDLNDAHGSEQESSPERSSSPVRGPQTSPNSPGFRVRELKLAPSLKKISELQRSIKKLY